MMHSEEACDMQRKGTLLVEYKQRQSANRFQDRRFGGMILELSLAWCNLLSDVQYRVTLKILLKAYQRS